MSTIEGGMIKFIPESQVRQGSRIYDEIYIIMKSNYATEWYPRGRIQNLIKFYDYSVPLPGLGYVSYSRLGRTYLTGVLEVHPTVWPRGHTTVTTNYTTVQYSFLVVRAQ